MEIPVMIVGASIAFIGIGSFIYFRILGRRPENNSVAIFNITFTLSAPSLVIFVVGAGLFILPFTAFWQDDDATSVGLPGIATPNPTQVSAIASGSLIAMFRENTFHSGGVMDSGPLESPIVRWTFPTGTKIASTPSVVGDIVYAAAGDALYALDATTGLELWRFVTTGLTFSSPAILGGLVYIGSLDGTVYAINQATGKKVWATDTTIAIDEGRVLEPEEHEVRSSPLATNDMVFIGSNNYNLYALDRETGAVRWRFPTGGRVESSPAAFGGRVFVGSWDQHLYALQAGSGNFIWKFPTDGAIVSSPAIADGTVFFGSSDGNVYAVTIAGDLVWKFPTGARVSSSPAVVDGIVYIGSDSDAVYAIDAENGSEIWRSPAQGDVFSSPVVANGVVYVGGGDTMYALDSETGNIIWDHPTDDLVESSAAIADGAVYFASWDGFVYALSEDGE